MKVELDIADIAFLRYIIKQQTDVAMSKARVCHESGDHYMHSVFLKQQSQLLNLRAKLEGVNDPVYLDYLSGKAPEPRD